jgi:predicted nucleic acid-binding protein
MNGRYLLDTNIIIALFDEDKKVIKRVNQAREVYTVSELVWEKINQFGGGIPSKRKV